MKNRKVCPKCGGTIGISNLIIANHTDPDCPISIACEKCQEVILYPVIKRDIIRIY